MPGIIWHKGVWEGTYRHIDMEGNTLDVHNSRVACIFPSSGETVYLQHNTFTWEDGRIHQAEFQGKLVGDKIYWDTDTFSGYGWITNDNIFLLTLDRKDDIGAKFHEIIVMGDNKNHRVRTWHWFKNGECFKRTLCNEYRIS